MAMVLLSGCGGGPRLVRVTGTVRRGGAPVPHLVVQFRPDEGRGSWGYTDAEGHFALKYDRQHDGAITGHHKVYVEDRGGGQGIPGATEPHKEMAEILEKYGDSSNPKIDVDIDRNNQEVTLDLD
jgi:hypothetical protein